MKLIIALTVLSLNVMAKDMTHYKFAVAGDERGEFHSIEATITEDQELKVDLVTTIGQPPFYIPSPGQSQSYSDVKRLNDVIFNLIKNEVIGLSTARIVKKTNVVVCMMIPGPHQANDHLSILRHYDHHTDEFLEEMKLILGPQGCWVSNPVYPKENYQMVKAQKLKSMLKVMALEFIGDKL